MLGTLAGAEHQQQRCCAVCLGAAAPPHLLALHVTYALNTATYPEYLESSSIPTLHLLALMLLLSHRCCPPPLLLLLLQDYDPVHLIADWDDLYVCCAEAKRKGKIDSDCASMPPRPGPSRRLAAANPLGAARLPAPGTPLPNDDATTAVSTPAAGSPAAWVLSSAPAPLILGVVALPSPAPSPTTWDNYAPPPTLVVYDSPTPVPSAPSAPSPQ